MVKQLYYGALAGLHQKQGIRQLRLLEKKLYSTRARFAVPFAYKGRGFSNQLNRARIQLKLKIFIKPSAISHLQEFLKSEQQGAEHYTSGHRQQRITP